MLKITIEPGRDVTTVRLAGRIIGPWAEELSRAWHSLQASNACSKLAVDLRDITFMDQAGQRVLAEMCREDGAEFIADTPLTRYFAEEAQNGNHNAEKRGHDHAGSLRS